MICAAGGRHLFTLSCPVGLFYDTSTETCQYPDQTVCQPPCPVTKSVTASQQSTVTEEKSTTTPDMSSVTDGESTTSTEEKSTTATDMSSVTYGDSTKSTEEKSTTTTDMSSVTDGDSTKSTVTDDTLTSQQMTVTGQGSITREGVTLTGTCTQVLKIFCSLIS